MWHALFSVIFNAAAFSFVQKTCEPLYGGTGLNTYTSHQFYVLRFSDLTADHFISNYIV